MTWFITITIIFVFLWFFISKKLSPVPYFPTNKKDLDLIVKSMSLKNNMDVVDIGAGEGRVIFYAANKALENKLDTKFYAVEINPVLILVLYFRKQFHKNS